MAQEELSDLTAREIEVNAEDLRQQQTSVIALVLTIAGCFVWFAAVTAPGFSWWRSLGAMALFIEGLVAYTLRRRRWLPQGILLLGPIAVLALALHASGGQVAPYFAVLIVLANFTISPPLGTGAAILCTVLITGLSADRGLPLAPLSLLWATVGVLWISQRGLHTVVQWAWSSQQQSLRLLEKLRENQGKLNRALHAMDEANARLATANERLAEARRLADEARQAKGRFAANVSHELRTPLSVIVGFSEVMYRSPQAYPGTVLSPAFLVDLGAVCRNAQHLQRLVDDVLDLAQLEAGKLALQLAEADLAAVMQEAADTVRSLAEGRGLALMVRPAPDLPPMRMDRTRIKQVLLNLLSNAIRHTETGSITVSAATDGSQVFCSVTDTGPGIPEELQGRLFEEFERGPGANPGSLASSGLGLAISRRLVQEHGGRIWVESEPGAGSTFTFSLPMRDEEAFAPLLPARRQVEAAESAEGDLIVLLTTSVVAARLFARLAPGYRCIAGSDPDQAIRQVADLQPRAVIVDAQFDAATVARVEQAIAHTAIPNIPLIVSPMPSYPEIDRIPQVKGFLAKPIVRQDLLDMLRTLGREVQTVLVVDDQEDVLRLFIHYLQDDAARPYRVLTAQDGQQALHVMRRERPDLVLLDLLMPHLDGYGFLRATQQEPQLAQVPVVVVSGQEPQGDHTTIEGRLQLQMPHGMSVEQLMGLLHGVLENLSRGMKQDA